MSCSGARRRPVVADAVPCSPLIRPFGPPAGVEPRVSTRPSDPRWGEEGNARPHHRSSWMECISAGWFCLPVSERLAPSSPQRGEGGPKGRMRGLLGTT
ncbi:hypothetical protein EFR00_17450 [Rhizobium sophoriradicis]|nr:hypothetical protein EFR00_17450 [Rhizobium sophoriradicis]